MFINVTLHDFIRSTHGKLFLEFFAGDCFPVASDIHGFSISGGGNIQAAFFCHFKPVFFAFTAKIPLDDKIASFLYENSNIIDGIIPGVQADQKRLAGQLFAELTVSLINSTVPF